jgi:oxygen-independent coproporphyrinogen-3 oxidase
VYAGAEITLEANPEDVTKEKLYDWKSMGINRLSIGLQSSHDQRLVWMNRNHSARDGEFAVKRAQDAGFDNITVDLMYGYPESTTQELREDLDYILSLQTKHISAYNLSIEPETVFGRQWKKGTLLPLPEEESADRFLEVYDALESAGYQGYEISNFAVPGSEAVHNRNYWLQKAFTGIGPSAHGFDGFHTRWENTPSNPLYIRDISSDKLSEKVELMNRSSLANEFILTRLRMKEGLSLSIFTQKFGISLQENREGEIQKAVNKGWLQMDADFLKLSREGRLMADHLALELFTGEEDFG